MATVPNPKKVVKRERQKTRVISAGSFNRLSAPLERQQASDA
jgi:hypothetical protein